MQTRLALQADASAIFALGREYARETAEAMPGCEFQEAVAVETFGRYLRTANPTFFVVEDRDGVIGFLMASMQPFPFMAGLWTLNDLMFVTLVKRGTRAAAELLAQFDRWSADVGAVMQMGGNANNLHTERTASLYEKFGYRRVGAQMVKSRSL